MTRAEAEKAMQAAREIRIMRAPRPDGGAVVILTAVLWSGVDNLPMLVAPGQRA